MNLHAVLTALRDNLRTGFLWSLAALGLLLVVVTVAGRLSAGTAEQPVAAAPGREAAAEGSEASRAAALESEYRAVSREYARIVEESNRLAATGMGGGNSTLDIPAGRMTPIGDGYALLVDKLERDHVHLRIYLENEFVGDKYVYLAQEGYAYETPTVACLVNLIGVDREHDTAHLQKICAAKSE